MSSQGYGAYNIHIRHPPLLVAPARQNCNHNQNHVCMRSVALVDTERKERVVLEG